MRRMRIVVIGASGLIGAAVVQALGPRHDVIGASRHSGVRVDLKDPQSIRDMYDEIGAADAIVSCAGEGAYKPLAQLTDHDFALSVNSKMMGQINVVRYGLDVLRDGGSFTITTGTLAQHPAPGSAALTPVNAALEGFARAVALELERGCRINAVSPGWVAETLAAMGRDPSGGTPVAQVAQAYVRAVEGKQSGQIIGV